MKKILLALTTVVILAGCASGGNQAYQAAHEAQAKTRSTEALARADADKTLAMAVASTGKACTEDMCRGMAMMALMSMKAAAGAAIQSAPAVIQAPVNEALEWAKILVPGAITAHANHLGAVVSIVNSTKGAADKDVATQGIGAITPVNPFATTPKQ